MLSHFVFNLEMSLIEVGLSTIIIVDHLGEA